MHTVFKSGPDLIRINITEGTVFDHGRLLFEVLRNGEASSLFTAEELHRVLDNARDVLLAIEGHGANYRGEFTREARKEEQARKEGQ